MKIKTSLFITAMFFSLPTMAAYTGPTSAATVTTAAQVAKAKDKDIAELTGYLVKSLGDEEYTFRDETGEVTVEVDDRLLLNVTVSELTKVKLIGEVDDDWRGNEVEIERLILVDDAK